MGETMKESKSDYVMNYFSNSAKLLVLLLLATIFSLLLKDFNFPESSIEMCFLLGVLFTARLTTGYVYGILSSVLSILIYNFFFTTPLFTFAVNDPSYFIIFGSMMITALVTSTLTSHFKKAAIDAMEKEAETRALYQLTNHLTDAVDNHDIASISISIISQILHCQTACLCLGEKEVPESTYIQHIENGKQVQRTTEQIESIRDHLQGIHTSYYIDNDYYNWPIYGRDNILGLIRIPIKEASIMTEAQNRLLRAMTESIALAMDRMITAQQKMHYIEETQQERDRGTLLRAISHDLRTPLSGIMGTSEILMRMSAFDDPRHDLAKQIWDNADWLHSLVENILSLTKLRDGQLILIKQLEPVEEVLGSAILHINNRYPHYEIKVSMPDELLMIPMDPTLITQVLINLLDNAIKHSSAKHDILITVEKNIQQGIAIFAVKDSGDGIKEEYLPDIFKMFYTTPAKHVNALRGIGLGLPICDAILKAHSGSISASNRLDGPGCIFTFTLPLEVKQDE